MLTMLIGGFWHGASWSFIIWGGLHGVALSIAHASRQLLTNKLSGLFVLLAAWVFTQFFVLITWIPFRAEQASDVFTMAQAFLPGTSVTSSDREGAWL